MSVPNLVERTHAQLGMLCRTLDQIRELASDSKSPSEGCWPAALKEKATDSVVRVLHQIDNIVEDMPRWVNAPTVLEKHYSDLLKHTAEHQQGRRCAPKSTPCPTAVCRSIFGR